MGNPNSNCATHASARKARPAVRSQAPWVIPKANSSRVCRRPVTLSQRPGRLHDEHDFGAAVEAGAKLAQRVVREPEAKPDVTMDHADLRMSLP
jgi:hypothetical protein